MENNKMTDSTKELAVFNGGVNEEQIASWKKEHRKIYAIEINDAEELYVGYFRRPGMETMSAVNKLAKTDEMKSAMTLFDNCWLGGDSVIKTDTLVKMAAIKQLGVMFNQVTSTLKNL